MNVFKKNYFIFAVIPFVLLSTKKSQGINFSEWKKQCFAICTANASQMSTPLTAQMILDQIHRFIEIKAQGTLSKRNRWVITDTKENCMPELDSGFLTGNQFIPFVEKIEVPLNSKIAFHGDIHGDIFSLLSFIEYLAEEGYMEKDNPFKIKDENFKIIFLGDYTDRGIWGIETIYTILELCITNPEKVILVRGNHEDIVMNQHFGLKSELQIKFNTSEKIITKNIERIYNLLPVALYLQSGLTQKNTVLCCHGGMEMGFDAKPVLKALGHTRYILLNPLNRYERFKNMPAQYKAAVAHLEFSGHLEDAIDAKKNINVIGFLWSDFDFESSSHPSQKVVYNPNRGWQYPEQMTKYILKDDSPNDCPVRGVFRAHQHNQDTMPYILNRLGANHPDDTGVAKLWPPTPQKQVAGNLWDGIVCTFCVCPHNGYGECFKYNFDSFGILTTADTFSDWKLAVKRIIPITPDAKP